MSVTAILVHPDASTLTLSASTGFVIPPGGFDRGSPVVREQAYNIPFGDGSLDNTLHLGPRNLTINVRLIPSVSGQTKEYMRRQLLRYMAPSLVPPGPHGPKRALIKFTVDNQPQMQAEIRPANFSVPHGRSGVADMTMQWVVPSGIYESAVLHSSTFSIAEAPTTPTPFVINNAGDALTYPMFTVFGPVESPTLRNITSGAVFALDTPGLIASGHSYEIDMRKKTVYYDNGGADSTDSKASEVEPTLSTWWPLYPGNNSLSVQAVDVNSPGYLQVQWRDGYL